ncbi:MotA/TolQ/ExbB proton channel family protein [Erythrobacter sp. NE805]|uniref:MotA/TolQ/ExbB proton channel family protein n=1 Tax=Erythrobacter sp. NE805 TaxID=3389875 RepID=UPI00396B398A
MTFTLLAAAAGEAPQSEFGFIQAMEQGGPVAWSILAIMVIMSVGSFYILFTKVFEQNKVLRQYKTVQTTFWRAASLKEGAAKLDKDSAWRQLADDAVKAQEDHGKMTDSLESHDYMHGSLQRSEDSINAVLNGGLAFLATVGATAPFVGLLGTVIGIYRALINIGIAGNASIDKVAGPVGEALIMTAIGLLVAVPAVFAFNYLQGRNRKIAAMLSTFSTDLLAYMNSNGAVKPTVVAAPAAKPAAKPAAAPATKA